VYVPSIREPQEQIVQKTPILWGGGKEDSVGKTKKHELREKNPGKTKKESPRPPSRQYTRKSKNAQKCWKVGGGGVPKGGFERGGGGMVKEG